MSNGFHQSRLSYAKPFGLAWWCWFGRAPPKVSSSISQCQFGRATLTLSRPRKWMVGLNPWITRSLGRISSSNKKSYLMQQNHIHSELHTHTKKKKKRNKNGGNVHFSTF